MPANDESKDTDEQLLDTPSDVDENEEEVLNHLMTVSMKSQKYDGLCGRIIDVRMVRDEDISDEQKQFIRKLSEYTENNKAGIDPDAQDKISQAQKQLRQSMNMDPKDEFEVALTVELPDGRTFTEKYTAPRFDSEEVDNDFLKLYRNILGNNVNRKDEIVGCWVPIDETKSTYGNTYDIDLDYYEDSEDNKSGSDSKSGFNISLSDISEGLSEGQKAMSIILTVLGTLLLLIML